MISGLKRVPTNNGFLSGPDLWHPWQEMVLESYDRQGTGLERLADDRSREEVPAILGITRIWQALRQTA